MSIEFVDRVSTYPNRYLVTPENGTAYYVTLERADEPTKAGTPLNAATMNKLAALTDIEKLPDMHIWKKYEGDPSLYTEAVVTDEKLVTRVAVSGITYDTFAYADSFVVSNGVVTLLNPTSISSPTASKLEATRGKYVCLWANREESTYCHYIPTDAVFTQITESGIINSYSLVVDSATKITSNKYLGSVMDTDDDTYPSEGTNEDDGCWYIYHKRFGDCNGNITDDQIAQAVTDYLEENPVSGGVTMAQVNSAIDTAIGDAIGGSY